MMLTIFEFVIFRTWYQSQVMPKKFSKRQKEILEQWANSIKFRIHDQINLGRF